MMRQYELVERVLAYDPDADEALLINTNGEFVWRRTVNATAAGIVRDGAAGGLSQEQLVAGIYGNSEAEAFYPFLATDSAGNKPDCSKHRYTMTFPAGQLPPVNAFWSVTMYDENYFFVANPINRYSISARQKLKANADGSLAARLTTLFETVRRLRPQARIFQASSSDMFGATSSNCSVNSA